jgi:hypothetical protein
VSREQRAGAYRMIDVPGIFPGMPEAVYHADPVTHGSLSSTALRTLLLKAPKHALDYVRSGRADTDAFERGRALHTEFLGVGQEIEVYSGVITKGDRKGQPVDSWSTGPAQEFRRKVREAGRIPLLAGQYAEIKAAVAELRTHPYVAKLLKRVKHYELTAVGQDPDTGEWIRGRLDFAPALDELTAIVLGDYKSKGRTASVEACQWATWEYRYDVQAVHMIRALQWAGAPVDPMTTPFVLIYQEAVRPYAVTVVELDEPWMKRAIEDHDLALRTWAECRASKRFPGYADDVVLIGQPRKAQYDPYIGEE